MKDKAFFKISRKIVNSAIWDDGTPYDRAHAWLDLLMYVNYLDGEKLVGEKIRKVKRGSTFASDQFFANRWHWSRARVRRFFDMLKAANMISVRRSPYGTWINVVNYAKYQDKQTANDTRVDTTNDTSNDTTDDTANDTQLKKEKKVRREESFLSAAAQKKIPPAKSDVEEYCREKNYHMDIDGFMTYYNMNGWTLSGGRKIQDWQAAVDYWHTNGKKLGTAETKPAPYFDEFENVPIVAGVESPFKNGAAAEMLRRKREKNVRQR